MVMRSAKDRVARTDGPTVLLRAFEIISGTSGRRQDQLEAIGEPNRRVEYGYMLLGLATERRKLSRKSPVTLKGEIATLLASSNVGSHALILDDNDVILLLKAAIEREGSISAFAKRHGLERSFLSNVLNGKRPREWPSCGSFGASEGVRRRRYASPMLVP